MNIKATGAGAQSNVVIQGSSVKAGNTVTLEADNQVQLLAAKNTASQTSSNSSSAGSIGVTMGSGGLGVTASASQGKGHADGQDTRYSNTHIEGDTVAIRSGGDTQIKGAVITANTVKGSIGGNFNVESLQDTSTYKETSKSLGGSVTIGPSPNFSVNASKTHIDSTYASVAEQSGIRAGDGGFQIDVKGASDLKGGAVTSTQAAVNAGKNSFTSAGGVTTSDIQNSASYNASSASISASVGMGTDPAGRNVPGGSAGVGSDKGRAASTTQAAISGVAGNKDARTGDAQAGIKPIFDQQKVKDEVNAQVAITAEFGRQAPKAWADYAQAKLADLKEQTRQAMQAGDDAKGKALFNEAKKWDEGGEYRVAGHALLATASGGASGAAGAVASAALMPEIGQLINSADLPAAVKQGLGMVASATLGGIVGGAAGAASAFNVDVNNRQLHPAESARIKQLANGDPQKEARLAAAACALVHCADGVPKDDPTYPVLKGMQDAGAGMKDEKALLAQQTGQEGRTTGRLFTYSGADEYLIDPLTQNKAGTRALGAVQAAAGIAGVVASSAICTTGVGCVLGAATGTVSADYTQAGTKQMATGNSAQPYGEQVLQSFGLSPQAAALTYAAAGMAPAAIEAVAINKAGNAVAAANAAARQSYIVDVSGAKGGQSVAGAVNLAETQAGLASKVADLRAALPSGPRTSGNMGVAEIDIPGMPSSMAASSQIPSPTAEQRALGFVGNVPETFPSAVVPTGSNPPYMLNRASDSEAKILNNIAARLGDNTAAIGTINLLTERTPCVSCSNIIDQFRVKYPNIIVNVFDNGGVIRPTRKP